MEVSWSITKVSSVKNVLSMRKWKAVIERLQLEGKTVSVLHNEQGIAALIALQDTIRPQAQKAIARLKKKGIKLAIFTGDQEKTAQAIAKKAGIDLVYAHFFQKIK